MFPSVRDGILYCGFPTIKEGLDALGMNAVEMEYSRENAVAAIAPTEELRSFTLSTPAGIEAFRSHLAENSTTVTAFLMANNFGSDDLDFEIQWAVTAIRAAHALGIPAIRIDAIMQGERDEPRERNVRIFAEAMKRILGATEDTPVELGIENHGFQGNDPEFLDSVLTAVGSSRLGLTIDTGNFYWRGHPLSRVYEIIEHFAPMCKHTHAKNIAYPEGIRETQREIGYEYGKYASPLADGDIDHKRVAAILQAAGYDRDLCLEDESVGRYSEAERKSVLKADADFLRSIL